MSYVRQDKEKGVNVQVLLRCRPSSEEELKSNAPQVIVCNDARREVTVGQNIAGKQSDRTFTFDKVFGPQAQQKDLYEQAIVPIVQEVLEGFNCTIFAYGQTGTGKTYTMEGSGRRTINGELPPDAGVIPRAIEQIFDTLESQNAEYSVKATFLELYNEEITDFLAPEEAPKGMDEKQRKPLALMEDGKGGVLIRGLEEVIVTNAAEIFHLLERGTAKRRTAETLLNKQSSRSHSIFAITIHIKEATPEGEDLIKCGKLNLVDLAGSENISRSGAREGRAREAGEINKSLLTLGRVITSLVEHLGHVPYRDSKLTRLLRDSLGGRTKTCIIATVSPSVHCLEETLSTLDYAHRAKNIKNKPEVNQKMMKSTLIKELYSEIERLKLEVHASREKNGVYIPCERFYQEEADKKAMAEKIERLQEELEINHRQLEDMQARYDLEHQFCKELSTQLESSQKSMEQMKIAIDEEKEEIMQAHDRIAEKDYIIQSQQQSESVLLERAAIMHSELEQTVQDIMQLFAKIERKEKVEAGNLKLVQSFQFEFGDRLEALRKSVSASVLKQQEHLQIFEDQLQSFMSYKENSAEELKKKVEDLKLLYFSRLQSLHELALAHEKESNLVLDRASSVDCNYTSALQDLLRDAVLEAELVLRGLQTTLLNQQQEIALFAQQQREGTRKNVEMTKDVSQLTLDAFDHLCEQASELGMYIDESELAKGNYLIEFERTFEEQAKEEEQQLLQSISEILAKSKAKKSALVHSTVSTLRERSKRDKRHLEDGMARVGKLASESHSHWVSHMKEAEDTNDDMTALLAARHCRMEELLQDCVQGTENVGEHWRRTQTSLVHQTREHLPVIEAISRESMELNAHFRGLIDNGRLAAQSEFDSCSRDLLARIEGTLANECELESGLQLAVTSQKHSLANLQSCHHSKAEELQRYAMHLLGDNYLEDSLTSATPPRRNISVPGKSSLEELRAPSIEALMKRYQECIRNDRMTTKALENLTTKQQPPKANGYSEATRVRESRIPLARLN